MILILICQQNASMIADIRRIIPEVRKDAVLGT
jgi:hypothetical protein